ncbi:MAG TPA: phosphohistidine phosphatase SixA [Candidatus Tectomicrobia bacterium]|nr:phosphohistidine phosphatase SixA [Candidatus Tectomicrobia bacterium]
MMISLLRHGIAAQRGSPGYENDNERPLTAKGERRMRRIAEGMLALGLSYDLMLSSPYLRARQTADIVAQVFKTPDGVQLSDMLTPEGNPRQLIETLHSDDRERQNILLVGHEPYLSRLISTLLTGNSNLPLVMKKGGLCTLDVETLRFGRCASLVSLLTPRQLRRLA